MRAGDLNTLVTLKKPSQTVASGNGTPQWTSQGAVWAKMKGIGGTFVGLTMEADYEFEVRYRGDITPRWRVEIGSRVFAIVRPPQDPDGKRIKVLIYAKEILS